MVFLPPASLQPRSILGDPCSASTPAAAKITTKLFWNKNGLSPFESSGSLQQHEPFESEDTIIDESLSEYLCLFEDEIQSQSLLSRFANKSHEATTPVPPAWGGKKRSLPDCTMDMMDHNMTPVEEFTQLKEFSQFEESLGNVDKQGLADVVKFSLEVHRGLKPTTSFSSSPQSFSDMSLTPYLDEKTLDFNEKTLDLKEKTLDLDETFDLSDSELLWDVSLSSLSSANVPFTTVTTASLHEARPMKVAQNRLQTVFASSSGVSRLWNLADCGTVSGGKVSVVICCVVLDLNPVRQVQIREGPNKGQVVNMASILVADFSLRYLLPIHTLV